MVWRGLFRALGWATGLTLVSAGSAASWNDLGALKMLHWATGGPSWTTSWPVLDTKSDPCLDHWYGVLCNTRGEILALKLSHNNLRGFVPTNFARLTALEVLDLSSNYLTEALPPALGNLVSLQTLRVDHNAFTGLVPETIAQLPHLLTLYEPLTRVCRQLDYESLCVFFTRVGR
ncbi:hypothetical protein, variant [Aphanomyces astaci]|uniref:Leucine-rich repeat-containing N-terminal plant-type domain-containing protein n=1 Tax=Aphanomyces astaci TaxID=112090 RepID=W4G8L3_APHAT|nr:hypothetical protein, variant [Aphanomyces astaci]ETV76037.1 hypothetical protein, variant [Aphanomyces astaci]|eukprot:XP_009834678.1 hypothetical protein, variant [Aphanomyces astaci]